VRRDSAVEPVLGWSYLSRDALARAKRRSMRRPRAFGTRSVFRLRASPGKAAIGANESFGGSTPGAAQAQSAGPWLTRFARCARTNPSFVAISSHLLGRIGAIDSLAKADGT
jgi:hypothetical protein